MVIIELRLTLASAVKLILSILVILIETALMVGS